MKARLIAMLLSFFAISIPVFANPPELPAQQAITNHKIDLNKADTSTLTGSFKGIGKKRAEAIVTYRKNHQGFKSIEELAEVKGLGRHFVEANREMLHKTYSVQ